MKTHILTDLEAQASQLIHDEIRASGIRHEEPEPQTFAEIIAQAAKNSSPYFDLLARIRREQEEKALRKQSRQETNS